MRSTSIDNSRLIKDKLARWVVSTGGLGLIALVVFIFFYLLAEVLPLFTNAELRLQSSETRSSASAEHDIWLLELDEQGEVLLQVDSSGAIVFEQLDGSGVERFASAIAQPVLLARDFGANGLFALAAADGSVELYRYGFKDDFSSGSRVIQTQLLRPYGVDKLQLELEGELQALELREFQDILLLAALDSVRGLRLFQVEQSFNLFTEEVTLTQQELAAPVGDWRPELLAINGNQRWLFTALGDQVRVFALRADGLRWHSNYSVPGLQSWQWLLGQSSLLLRTADSVQQWSMVNYGQQGQRGFEFSQLRSLRTDELSAESILVPAQRSRSFIALDSSRLLFVNTTAEKYSLDSALPELSGPVRAAALSPRADNIYVRTDSGSWLYSVDNPYPEISLKVLWGKIWYENYPEPRHIWQSSAATDDFEPKLSLVPLTYGTLKSAFYAMLLAAPLAVLAAIYTSYFMAPTLRRKVKPAIEMMEAVPTVILGFIAGLFLAPFVENNLGAVCLLILLGPGFILLLGQGARFFPAALRRRLEDGWHLAFLLPALALFTVFILQITPTVEQALLGTSTRNWFTTELGIDYDQRNALVIGIAMGFAVIPSIFSVAEDALFGVPAHLSNGSLALGANRWQTLYYVVLPTASPGIFSALSIGFGRAVGETMIVLMATGNTPIMDASIFTGMRTLAANIAVEIPESVVGSSHFRVLFLSGLVLFAFTFVLNTVAEFVRQNLRKKYGSL